MASTSDLDNVSAVTCGIFLLRDRLASILERRIAESQPDGKIHRDFYDLSGKYFDPSALFKYLAYDAHPDAYTDRQYKQYAHSLLGIRNAVLHGRVPDDFYVDYAFTCMRLLLLSIEDFEGEKLLAEFVDGTRQQAGVQTPISDAPGNTEKNHLENEPPPSGTISGEQARHDENAGGANFTGGRTQQEVMPHPLPPDPQVQVKNEAPKEPTPVRKTRAELISQYEKAERVRLVRGVSQQVALNSSLPVAPQVETKTEPLKESIPVNATRSAQLSDHATVMRSKPTLSTTEFAGIPGLSEIIKSAEYHSFFERPHRFDMSYLLHDWATEIVKSLGRQSFPFAKQFPVSLVLRHDSAWDGVNKLSDKAVWIPELYLHVGKIQNRDVEIYSLATLTVTMARPNPISDLSLRCARNVEEAFAEFDAIPKTNKLDVSVSYRPIEYGLSAELGELYRFLVSNNQDNSPFHDIYNWKTAIFRIISSNVK